MIILFNKQRVIIIIITLIKIGLYYFTQITAELVHIGKSTTVTHPKKVKKKE